MKKERCYVIIIPNWKLGVRELLSLLYAHTEMPHPTLLNKTKHKEGMNIHDMTIRAHHGGSHLLCILNGPDSLKSEEVVCAPPPGSCDVFEAKLQKSSANYPSNWEEHGWLPVTHRPKPTVQRWISNLKALTTSITRKWEEWFGSQSRLCGAVRPNMTCTRRHVSLTEILLMFRDIFLRVFFVCFKNRNVTQHIQWGT